MTATDTALAVPDVRLPDVKGPPLPGEWAALREQAEVIHASGLAPDTVDSIEKVLVIALKGRELNVPPMQALSHIHVIKGKPTMSAELMGALVRSKGHRIRVVETSNDQCVLEGTRADDPDSPTRLTYSLEDAKTAGLLSADSWKKHPAAMLRARATSALCRLLFGDVLMGASYTPEELGADVDPETGEIIDLGDTNYAPTELADYEATLADARRFSQRTHDYIVQNVNDATQGRGLRALPADQRRRWVDWAATTLQQAKDTKAAQSNNNGGDVIDVAPVEKVGSKADARTRAHRALMAALTAAAANDDDTRHALVGWVTDGQTESSRDLIGDDGPGHAYRTLMETADRIKAGTLTIAFNADGQLELHDTDGNPVDPQTIGDQLLGDPR